jgi:urease accessory protein
VLTHRRQRFPLRVTVPHYLDESDLGMPFVIVQNPTGGVFAGDRLHLVVEAQAGARAHVRTQSATKVYRMDGGSADQTMGIRIEDGAYVEYLPGAVIPQAGAVLRQSMIVDAHQNAAFVTSETIAAGRIAFGERFRFDRLTFETRVSVAGVEVSVDELDLEPQRCAPGAAGIFGTAAYLSTVFAVCPRHDVADLARRVDASIADVAGERGGASVLPHAAGVIARVLTPTVAEAQAAVSAAWQTIRLALNGRPIPRRLA